MRTIILPNSEPSSFFCPPTITVLLKVPQKSGDKQRALRRNSLAKMRCIRNARICVPGRGTGEIISTFNRPIGRRGARESSLSSSSLSFLLQKKHSQCLALSGGPAGPASAPTTTREKLRDPRKLMSAARLLFLSVTRLMNGVMTQSTTIESIQ